MYPVIVSYNMAGVEYTGVVIPASSEVFMRLLHIITCCRDR